MATFEIAELWIYPVKSLGGFSVGEAAVTPAGSLAGDREWLVVDLEGRMLWQGDLPKMTLLQAVLDDGALHVSQRNGLSVSLPANHDGEPVTVSQYGTGFAGIDAGDSVAHWLGAFLDHPCRLVRIGDQAHRWSGLNPLHVISTRSLAVLNQRMLALGDVTIERERLRPNVVLAGEHEPFAEESAAVIGFGDCEIVLNEPCIRCELPNISRVDASRQRQPLKLIGEMSKQRATSKPASFGTYARAVGSRLRVGMASCGHDRDATR